MFIVAFLRLDSLWNKNNEESSEVKLGYRIMLSSGTFCSDEDMVVAILHPHQQSLIVPSLR